MATERGARWLAVALCVTLTATACGGPSTDEAFCSQVQIVQAAGPLFPARTDGEPVPNAEALEAIVGLSDHRPEAIADDLDLLVEAAQSLNEEARQRLGQTAQVQPPERRWSRSAVESAQRAVIEYAAQTCDIDLNPSQG